MLAARIRIDAEPAPIDVDTARAALIIIDMQRDFLEPGGFGEALGNDVSRLAAAIVPCRKVLDAARHAGMLVIHTREGHRAARHQSGSAHRGRWAASSCAASRDTTSFPSFIPCRANQ
jgi:nicotinamidase-related amidase